MSPRSVAEKLLVKPGSRIWTSHPDRIALLGLLPGGFVVQDAPDGAGVTIVFADDAAAVRRILVEQGAAIGAADVVWVAYPKANRTDVNRDTRGRSSPNTACGRSRRSPSTTPGPRSGSGPTGPARRRSPVVAERSPRPRVLRRSSPAPGPGDPAPARPPRGR
jgi:hypothetical protein